MTVNPQTRRTVLSVLALGALAAGCAARDLPDPAAAWRDPGAGERDPRLFALAHAILAPNPHNRQPWLVELPADGEILLYLDRSRRLPQTDPFDRQLVIGCGAFLEMLAIAAGEVGAFAEITPFPEGADARAIDDRPIARVRLHSGGPRDPLYAAIAQRRSNKEAYDPKRAIAPGVLARLLADAETTQIAAAGALSGDPTCEKIRALVPAAYRREIETPAALKESVDLMRIGKAEIARHRDGIDLDFPGIGLMQAANLLSREKMLTPGTMAYEQGLAMYDPLAATAAGFVWLTSAGGREGELAAGRRYARLNLAATAQGVAMHPVSQALQEYPEMADLKARMEDTVGLPPGQTLQMLARIGYGPATPPAPRRGLSEHLRT